MLAVGVVFIVRDTSQIERKMWSATYRFLYVAQFVLCLRVINVMVAGYFGRRKPLDILPYRPLREVFNGFGCSIQEG